MSANPAKATIAKLSKQGTPEDAMPVFFNPKELTVSKQNNWKQNNTPKENVPSGEFTGGGAESLKVQLFFDTYRRRARRTSGRNTRRKSRA